MSRQNVRELVVSESSALQRELVLVDNAIRKRSGSFSVDSPPAKTRPRRNDLDDSPEHA